MPLYQYKCQACGLEQEHLQRMGAEAPECEGCGADEVDDPAGGKTKALTRELTAPTFRFRGSSGWGGIEEVSPGWGMRKVEGQ